MPTIHLTAEQAQAIERTGEQPPTAIDPRTNTAYVLVRADVFERARPLLERPAATSSALEALPLDIPAGIRRSQEAYWRELPELLREPGNHGKWVAYHESDRLGIAMTERELIHECVRRGLRDDEYYTGVIEHRPLAPWEVEEIEPRPFPVEDGDGTAIRSQPA